MSRVHKATADLKATFGRYIADSGLWLRTCGDSLQIKEPLRQERDHYPAEVGRGQGQEIHRKHSRGQWEHKCAVFASLEPSLQAQKKRTKQGNCGNNLFFLNVCMSRYHMSVWYPRKPEDDTGPPGTRVIDSYKPPVDAGNWTTVLWKSIQCP